MIRLRYNRSNCNVCGLCTAMTAVPSFSLPTDYRRQRWLDALGLTPSYYSPCDDSSISCPSSTGLEVSVSVICENDLSTFTVCGRHFLPSMFTRINSFDSVVRFTLNTYAIPTLIKRDDWNLIFEWPTAAALNMIEESGRNEEDPVAPPSARIPPLIVGAHGHIDHNYLTPLEPKPVKIEPTTSPVPSTAMASDNSEIQNGTGGIRVKLEPVDTWDTKESACVSGITVKMEEVEEELEVLVSGQPIDQQRALVVEASSLAELFTVCRTSGCGRPVPSGDIRTRHRSGRVSVLWKCTNGHEGQWASSGRVNGSKTGNGKRSNAINSNEQCRSVADTLVNSKPDQCQSTVMENEGSRNSENCPVSSNSSNETHSNEIEKRTGRRKQIFQRMEEDI